MNSGYLATGQTSCHDLTGRDVPCNGSGQDAEFGKGKPWPTPRFETEGELVLDCLTGLVWTRDANPDEFPMRWQEALDYVTDMNRRGAFGFADWRLPNRRELRSLVSHQTKLPALPKDSPFLNVFHGWYWSSTTAVISPAHAWYVHMEGARMFYGGKDESFLVWPVRGAGSGVLPTTGQTHCYDETGEQTPCARTGQDGELRCGHPWPHPRFEVRDVEIIDRLTGLCWRRAANLTAAPLTWGDALAAIARLDRQAGASTGWRLPNINELESLVDCSSHSPALPGKHPFTEVQDVYWSSTTSLYEPDWAWALYLDKGAVGIGQKSYAQFYVWAVRDYD